MQRKDFLRDLDYIYGEDDQDWREMRQEKKQRKKEMLERKEAEKKARGSKDHVRRLEVFDISEGDDEMVVIDDLMEWYLGEDVERVRMINDRQYERDWYEPVEVCLDSGADCHVLPLSSHNPVRIQKVDPPKSCGSTYVRSVLDFVFGSKSSNFCLS